jgi:DNA-binding NarL/FixJ family response regulator
MRQTIRAIFQLPPDRQEAEELVRQLAMGEPVMLQLALAPAPAAGPDLDPALLVRLRQQGLSERQAEVLVLDAKGWTRTAIAAHFSVSKFTVKWYWANIYAILGLSSRAAARALVWQMLAEVRAEVAPEHERSVGDGEAPR